MWWTFMLDTHRTTSHWIVIGGDYNVSTPWREGTCLRTEDVFRNSCHVVSGKMIRQLHPRPMEFTHYGAQLWLRIDYLLANDAKLLRSAVVRSTTSALCTDVVFTQSNRMCLVIECHSTWALPFWIVTWLRRCETSPLPFAGFCARSFPLHAWPRPVLRTPLCNSEAIPDWQKGKSNTTVAWKATGQRNRHFKLHFRQLSKPQEKIVCVYSSLEHSDVSRKHHQQSQFSGKLFPLFCFGRHCRTQTILRWCLHTHSSLVLKKNKIICTAVRGSVIKYVELSCAVFRSQCWSQTAIESRSQWALHMIIPRI